MAERSLLDWLGALLRELERARVPHALAGGLAVAAWAQPRATVDIDLVIAASDEDLQCARAACERAGLLQTRARVAVFPRIRMLRMLTPLAVGNEPIAVDLLLVPPALERRVFARAVPRRLGGRSVAVVSAEDIVLLKLLRLSDQDLVDIKAIAGATRLDRRYLRQVATELRMLTRLRRAGLR